MCLPSTSFLARGADTDSVGGLSGNKSPERDSEALRGKGVLFFSALFYASCKILQTLQEEEKGWGRGSSLLLA